MIQVNISEIKNRLSYYLKLVRGGEQIEILDRKIPVARLIHISQTGADEGEASWIKEMQQLGIVSPPRKRGGNLQLLAKKEVISSKKRRKHDILAALLEERESGR